MSSTTLPGRFSSANDNLKPLTQDLTSGLLKAVRLLASLKLTCVMFILAMVIIFVGSLAQSRRDVWQVMGQYFRTYLAWIDVQDLFPPSMFGELGERVAARAESFRWINFRYLPFPGGWTIGWIMLANLVAAHSLKFKVRAEGVRLAGGLTMIVLGLAMTVGVVYTGNFQTGVEAGDTVLTAIQIWVLILGVLAVCGLSSVGTALMFRSGSMLSRGVLIGIGAAFIGVFLYFVIGGEQARLNLSSMRILWQLLKGSACSLVLLLGCFMLFDKRGGIALLHFGVAMLMISELQVGLLAKENMLSLVEGESSVFVRDIRERELAIVTQKSDGKDSVVVIPEVALTTAAEAAERRGDSKEPFDPAQVISVPSLPFDIVVRRFYRNSRLRNLLQDDTQQTATGLGSFATPEPLDPVDGMDDKHDESSVYVDLIKRESGETLQTLLISQTVSELQSRPLAEKAAVDGTDYYLYLRFQRNYRDYEVKLLDVSRTNYVGTATPRDYRSVIEITDSKNATKDKYELWMNNPLRYKGETFYQSGFIPLSDGKEASTISVVNNTGWMLPYIACMMVSFGMFAQFGQTLFRFLDRTQRSPARASVSSQLSAVIARPGFAPALPTVVEESALVAKSDLPAWIESFGFPLAVTLILAAWLGSGMRSPSVNPEAMNLYGAAQLPIAWSGRPQPIDSVARTLLLMTSHKSTFQGELEPSELNAPEQRAKMLKAFAKAWPTVSSESLSKFEGSYPEWIEQMAKLTASGQDAVDARMRPLMIRKRPAVQWFLDVITRPEIAARHRVIRIDDGDVLALLGLEKRPGMTYSMIEIQKNFERLEADAASAAKKQQEKQENSLTNRERRVTSLLESMRRVTTLAEVFNMERSGDPERGNLASFLVESWDILRRLEGEPAVMAVPTGSAKEQPSWETMVAAVPLAHLNRQLKQRGITSLDQLLVALRDEIPGELASGKKVAASLTTSYEILKNQVPAVDPEKPESIAAQAEAIRTRAGQSAEKLSDADAFLRGVLQLIAAAPVGQTAEQIAAAVTDEQALQIGREMVGAEMFLVLSTLMQKSPEMPELQAVRARLQAVGVENRAAFTLAVNEQSATLAWNYLQKRAGHLLPGGDCSETFDGNAFAMMSVLNSWKSGNAPEFNTAVTDYQALLASAEIPHVHLATVRLESWFNYFEPFYKAICIYLPVIVLSFAGWLFAGHTLRRTSLALMILAFAVHSVALVLRMEISGRPPVTSLYSSAIFIGWAMVVAAFIVEMFLKNGIGNVLGASVGAGTLVIAHYLARGEGDTFGVMQAVLDTTFWLATHVVCITLGYAATFLAGVIGLFYCIQAALGRPLSHQKQQKTEFTSYMKLFGKLVYGTLCFAVFFSLVGTVLGGLWADDSWGRFWGWDPKENGAMMIVLWNALILHARWGKMVGDYGTSILAMIGNIVTSWSWFGVNELGAGLHEYGFTEGRLLALVAFITVQLLLIIAFTAIGRFGSVKIANAAA